MLLYLRIYAYIGMRCRFKRQRLTQGANLICPFKGQFMNGD
jgi:hypothetical protein